MATEFTVSEYKMILWSFDYIRHNYAITTDQLPDVLVKFWSVPHFLSNPQCRSGSVQVLVFMFILRLQQGAGNEQEEEVNSFYFNQLFYDFQILLATIDYCRNHGFEVPSFPIFDVKNYVQFYEMEGEQLLKEYDSFVNKRGAL